MDEGHKELNSAEAKGRAWGLPGSDGSKALQTISGARGSPLLINFLVQQPQIAVTLRRDGTFCQRRYKIRPRGGVKPSQAAVAGTMARELTI